MVRQEQVVVVQERDVEPFGMFHGHVAGSGGTAPLRQLEDEPCVWIGLGYREYLSVGALQEAMRTRIPDVVRTRLTLDQKVGASTLRRGGSACPERGRANHG
jgi:hypothetical protein